MYELDLTGSLPANRIVNERKIIANCANNFRCFIPDFAPFFRDGLELRQIVSGRTVDLIEGLHYYLGHYYEEGTVASKRKVYGSVMLIEPMAGVLEFTRYNTMGGHTNTTKEAIAQHLGKPDLADPRNIDWREVMAVSTIITPMQKPESYAEAISSDEIIAELENLNKAMNSNINGGQSTAYRELQASITHLNDRMISEGFYSHPSDPTAHAVSIDTLGTYSREGTVDDTLKAYGKTLDELVDYCLQHGIPQADIDAVMDKHTAMKGVINLTAQQPIKVPGEGVIITESDTGTNISAKGSITLQADMSQKRAGIAASVHSGTHVLSTYSAGINYRTGNSVMVDGFTLIDKYSLADYLSGYSGATAQMNLNTQNTATVTLSGRGTQASPLKADATFPIASRTQKGLMMVTNTIDNMPANKGCSTRILYEIDKTVSQYALGVYTLNGKPLTSDVTLTLADFGLGRVDNTRLVDKPLSQPWLAAVAGKARSGHTHPMDQEYQKATPDKAGTVMLTDIKDTSVTNRAATVKLAKQYLQEVQTEAGKRVNIMVGRTIQIGQVPSDAIRITGNGLFIAYVVQE